MTKLEELLNAISDTEFKKLLKASDSRPDLQNALHLGREQLLKEGKIDHHQLYCKTTGQKKYKDKAGRYLQSELVEYLENFMLQEYLTKNRNTDYLLKLKTLTERNCNKSAIYYNLLIGKNDQIKDAHFHLTSFECTETTLRLTVFEQKRKIDPGFATMQESLDSYYLTKSLQLLCEQANYSNVVKIEAHTNDLVLSLAASIRFEKVISVSTYLKIYKSLTEPDNEINFNILIDDVKKNANCFSPLELIDIYTYLKNFCIRRINSGKIEYYNILFSIYKDYISNERLMKQEYLSEFEFKNIVSVSVRVKELKWCEIFLKDYATYLRPESRQNALNYNQAFLYFNNGKYKYAIRKVQDLEFTDIIYQLDSRALLLKCYYELDEDDQFFYHASAFRLFILRNRHLSEHQKKINRNLIRFLTALRRNAGNERKLTIIREEILQEKNVADLNWLLQKTNELLD